MDHLSPAQLEILRAKLEAELAQLDRHLAEEARALADTPEAEPGDIEDAAASEAGRFAANSLLERVHQRRAAVEAALARMADGSYGICEDTDDEIPFRRLELRPTTRYSVEAQAEREAEGVHDPHADEPIVY